MLPLCEALDNLINKGTDAIIIICSILDGSGMLTQHTLYRLKVVRIHLTESSSYGGGSDSEDSDWAPDKETDDVAELVAEAKSFTDNPKMRKPV